MNSSFIDFVEQALAAALNGAAPRVARRPAILLEAARHVSLASEAKRARPELVRQFGELLGAADLAPLVDIAVTAEMMHAASLLHDDVVDEGTTRRGLPTANVRWGNTVAVLSGDMLLCLGLMRLHAYPPELTRECIDTVAQMTAAVMSEVECRAARSCTLADWRVIAEGKTGALLAWCGRAAAHLFAPEASVDDLGEIGARLGVAFQIGDDMLDFAPAITGKSGYADLRTGSPNFVVLRALELDPSLAPLIADARDEADFVALTRRVVRAGAMRDALVAVEREVELVSNVLRRRGIEPSASPIGQWADSLVSRLLAAHEVVAAGDEEVEEEASVCGA